MTIMHPGDPEFPYTVAQLANALLFLCDNSSLVTRMKEKDEMEVPVFENNEDADKWHTERDHERSELFMEMCKNMVPEESQADS